MDKRKLYRVPLGDRSSTLMLLTEKLKNHSYPDAELVDDQTSDTAPEDGEKAGDAPQNKAAEQPQNKAEGAPQNKAAGQ